MRNLRAINRFGSKVGSAHRYPDPTHRRLIEPFAGGAGYALLHHTKDVVLADVDPTIVGVWRYLIDASPERVRTLPLIGPEQEVAELDCDEGGRLLISWALNQTATPRKRLSSWGVYHQGRACYWGHRRREQAAVIASRVKHWTVLNASFDSLENEKATWFIDPPYVDGGASYAFSQVDYPTLADWCRTRRGQVMVCERVGASWLPFWPLYSAPTARRFMGNRTRCAEAIWMNEEPRQTAMDFACRGRVADPLPLPRDEGGKP